MSLAEVERLAEEVAGVRRAVAVAERSGIVGEIVALRYSLEPGEKPEDVQPRLEDHLRQHLRKEAWPRRWQIDSVGLGLNSEPGKELIAVYVMARSLTTVRLSGRV